MEFNPPDMSKIDPVNQLFSIRNQFGPKLPEQKIQLLTNCSSKKIRSKNEIQNLWTSLLFLRAYPDNKTVSLEAKELMDSLVNTIQQDDDLQYKLYNSGITGTTICAAFGFEIVKWLRQTRCTEIKFNSFEADDAQVQAFLSVIMSKAESEIFQDGNAEWKSWLKNMRRPGEDILDQLIAIFDSSNQRPEVKDEIWNAIGINVEINLATDCCLPASLIKPFYHRALIRKEIKNEPPFEPVQVKLSDAEAKQVIDCSRMILIRHLREIDPVSFTAPSLVSYYHLSRGVSIALMEMVPDRRHPIDSYLGYTVFKNGLPLAYAGSWVLFNSARIGLNVFPAFRGGENRFVFDQVLRLHAQVYKLKRFTADPYQIGKDNSDGIKSGAFWVYYHAGFRPIEKQQKELAETEAEKIAAGNKYRSSPAVLKQLAESRLEKILQDKAVRFDATDLSRVYASILTKKYKANRLAAEKDAAKKLAGILQIKNYQDADMQFVLQNWAVFLLGYEKELRQNKTLKSTLKKLFNLKTEGSETAYIATLQKSPALQKLIEQLVKDYDIR